MVNSQIKIGFDLLPRPIVDHLRSKIQSRPVKPHVYHVTELIYCLRRAWYKRVYPERIQWSIRGLWNVYRGSTFDNKWTPLFKTHQRNYKVRRRGVTITGTFDFIYDTGNDPILYDLKMPASVFYRKRKGAGQGRRRQVQAYIALAHANGEFLDVHRARVLMVAEDVVVEDVPEWTDMLDAWLWTRAFLLDRALRVGSPVGLPAAEEEWECGADPEGDPYCPADAHFRFLCRQRARKPKVLVKCPVEGYEETPEPEYVKEIKELLY